MGDDSKLAKRSRRELLAAAGSGTTILLAGCIGDTGEGDGDDTQSGGGGETAGEIDYWTTQVENDRQQVIRSVIEDFESDHETNVQMVAVNEDDLPSEISAARAAGTLPAAAEVGLGPMKQLGSGGLLSTEAANSVIESVGEDDFYDGPLSLTQDPEGGNYAVPFHGWLQGFWYSNSVFEENDLDEPTTWDALLTAAETLHDPDNNQYGIVIGTDRTKFARDCFTPFARSNGARLFNEDGDIVFDSDEMIEALEFYAQLNEYTPPGKDTWETANNTYLNDQCHLIEYSSYIMGDIAEQSQEMVEDTGFASFVEKERKSSYGQIVTLSILSSASDPERTAAETWANYLFQEEAYAEYLHMAPGGMNPVLESAASSESYQDDETLEMWGETVEQISSGFANMERFGYVDGQSFTEMGDITSQLLVAEAISRVTNGDDPETVANEQADKMRDAISD